MNTKFLSAFSKPVVSFIKWIGGAVAGIVVIFSAIGFLVIRGHHDLLGINGFVPMPADTWTVEGARFAYNSLFYFWGSMFSWWGVLFVGLAAGVGLLVSMTHKPWFQEKMRSHIAKAVVIGISFALLVLMTNVFAQYGKPSHLLVEEQTYDDEIALRASKDGIEQLRARYAMLLAMLAVGFIWLHQLPHALNIRFVKIKPPLPAKDSTSFPASGKTPTHTSTGKASNKPPSSEADSSKSDSKAEETVSLEKFSYWHIMVLGLWLFFLIPLLSLPINYGKMAKENRFLKVRLIRTLEEMKQQSTTSGTGTASLYEGWLLYEDAERIVVYKGSLTQEPINIFTRKDFAHIQILAYNNIFAVP